MSIIEGRFDAFVREFMRKYFPKGDVPKWCVDALRVAGIDLVESSSVCVQTEEIMDWM